MCKRSVKKRKWKEYLRKQNQKEQTGGMLIKPSVVGPPMPFVNVSLKGRF